MGSGPGPGPGPVPVPGPGPGMSCDLCHKGPCSVIQYAAEVDGPALADAGVG